MADTGEIRRRVRRMIAESRRTAEQRRTRTTAAAEAGQRVLRSVVTPAFKAVAASLKAEGFSFRVSTPPDAVKMASESSNDNFIELALDTTGEVPVFRGRVSRARGRGVRIDEQVVAEGAAIGSVSEEDVLRFLLGELGPFVEK